jgi:uncharacterized LabA/DUF88 family protein
VSKNVAVFVDVANIFYAAKAAGVDIDYVTLLKSATAGRDFVRAYAYTGLDPDNENQRQFHSFLTRSGYKVVSKDIRKYGDGRIKANLDIELVVDLMRMADHIDIAVVVSGDGDFAPAIRAVQQEGVRVEVVSFRGNTSSDLIEVADVFTDISQIARVEKGARSGRRVAAGDDLSMTEVPEKETEMGPRRRRGERRSERDDRAASRSAAAAEAETSADAALPGNLIVLPGERLSRAEPGAEEAAEEIEAEPSVALDAAEEPGEGTGRRRRRRRGGRGRGRGRPQDLEAGTVEPGAANEDELLEEELAPLPQHSTFGSVWDTQIGVSPAPRPAASYDESDEDEDEPEIPEYLLAERRQQNRGRGGRGQRQGGRGGYRAAVDRERYGRSGSSLFGGSRMPDRGRSHGGQRQQPARHQRPPAEPRREHPDRPASSAEPWSEVPPEVQELLRAELARRQGQGRAPSAVDAAPTPEQVSVPAVPEANAPEIVSSEPVAAPTPSTAGRARRTRTPAASAEATEVAEAATEAPAARTATRRRTTRAATKPDAEAGSGASSAEAPKPTPARRTRRSTAASADATADTVADATADTAAKPATTRRTTRSKASEPVAEGESAPAPKPRRRSSRSAAATEDASTDQA